MKWPLAAIAFYLAVADVASGLDAESRRLAERYLTVLDRNPTQQTVFDRLWKIHADAGEIESLIEACRQRAAENPILYARLLQRAGRAAEAKQVFGDAAEGGNIGAAEMLAGMLEEEGEIRTAADLLQKIAAVHENQRVLVRLGELLQKAGESEKSRVAFERAAALAPDDLVLRKRLAAANAQAGDWEAAVDHLRVIAQRGSPPERFAALSEISLRLEEGGNVDEALAAQESLLGLMGPDHWQLHSARRRLLNLHQENHSLQTLEKRWRQEADASPQNPLFALRMAEFYEFQGDETLRRDWLIKAAALLPKDLRLACEVASLDLSLGYHEAAAERYDKVLAARPNDGDIALLRAEVSALLGQEAEAEKRVEDYLAARENDDAATARAMDFYRRMRLFAPLERKLAARFRAHPSDEQAVSELARYYLDQRRDREAVECLSRFDVSLLDNETAAAVALRFSELLKGSEAREQEQRWAQIAFERDPSKPEYALRLADLLEGAGETEAVVGILRQACESYKSGPPREDLDRRLFLALQAKERGGLEEKGKPVKTAAVKDMIASLEDHAVSSQSEAAWLRLARWLLWTEAGSKPAAALRRGLEAIPQSKALQEALAMQLTDSADFAAAIEAFKRLAELAPERSEEIRRRIAHLEVDRGNSEEGLRIFKSLAKDSKDWQAVADLALAEQMAGNWFEAFEIWQRAYGLAPPSTRRTIRSSILNAATRLQLHSRGLDFFEKASVSEGDTAARRELLNEAASYAIEHGLAGEWRSRLERHSRTSVGELSWREGIVFLLTAEGRLEEARQTLRASTTNAEDSVERLERLIKLADDIQDWEEAAGLARRLASLVGPHDPSPSMRQANFLERAHRGEEAETVWIMLAARHARTPEVLSAAGDFFERAGKYERAERSYRAAARFSGCSPQIYLSLGRYALERGDRSQALRDFEQLLAETRPEIESLSDCLPSPDRILFAPAQTGRGGLPAAVPWKVASERDSEGCRLLAIREAAQILDHSPLRQKWVEKFSVPIERVWARYYSGDKAGAFPEIERIVSISRTPPLEQAFAASALEEGEGDRLARWAANSDDRQTRWDNILVALARMLDADWKPSSELAGRLFSYAPALPRWRAAQSLAEKNFLQVACALGESVPPALPSSQACSAWIELARWRIALCEPEKAITSLDQAIDSAPASVSFGEPLFVALRARWLLTPESDRPAFEQEVTERLKRSKPWKCQMAAAALIAGLKGDDAAGAERIADVTRALGTAEGESWSEVIQQGGHQLEEWNLKRLARDLYRNDLARNSALLSMRGENFHESTTKLFIFNQLLSADRDQISYLLNEWLARAPSDRELLDAVMRLQRAGRSEAAAAVYSRLCQRNPRNEAVAMGILNLSRVRLMREAGTAFMERLLVEESFKLGRAMVQTAGLRLATILDEEGEYDRSLAILSRLGEGGPLNKPLLFQHVHALRRAGRHREALAELEANPLLTVSPEFTIPLAELFAGLARERDAYALLEREARGSSANRRSAAFKLRELALQTNDQSRAAIAEALLGSLDGYPGSQKKSDLTEADWKRTLSDLDKPHAPPEERFRAGRSVLIVQQNLPAHLREQELERLKRIARRHRSLIPELYVLRRELAERFGSPSDLLEQLSREWEGGRGNYYAGETMIQIFLQQKRYEQLGRFLNDYLADAHFNEKAWDQLGRRLLVVKQYELAARVFSELRTRAQGDPVRLFLLAEALSQTGKQDAADALVSSIKGITLFDPQKHIDLAEFYLKTGRPFEAKAHLIASPVDVRTGAAWTHAMERFLERKNFAEARACLLYAIDSPQAVPARVLADYYMRSGEMAQLDPRVNEFDLPPRQFRDLQIEIASRLLSANDMERAWLRIESIDSLLDDAQGRRLVQMLEHTDWNRAEKLWSNSESFLWDARCAAAQFYVRRAQAAELPATAFKDLQRAHQLHPGSFSIARAYVDKLLQQNDPAAARKVLRDLIDAYAEPGDRLAARQLLSSLQASPSLPKRP